MSTSEKQIAANRKNARKSTGPKTQSGKQTVSRNAVTHGAFARDLIIYSPYLKEDSAEFERLLASLTDELRPETLFQESLVRKIANCLWRGRRVIAAETAHIVKGLDNLAFDLDEIDDRRELANKITKYEFTERSPEETDDLIAAVAKTRSIPDHETTRHLQYYEMRLDRQITRAYKLFKELKRSAQPVQKDAVADLTPSEPALMAEADNPTGVPSAELPKTNPIVDSPSTT